MKIRFAMLLAIGIVACSSTPSTIDDDSDAGTSPVGVCKPDCCIADAADNIICKAAVDNWCEDKTDSTIESCKQYNYIFCDGPTKIVKAYTSVFVCGVPYDPNADCQSPFAKANVEWQVECATGN